MSMTAAVITGRNHMGISFKAKASTAKAIRPGRRSRRRTTDRIGWAPSRAAVRESAFFAMLPL